MNKCRVIIVTILLMVMAAVADNENDDSNNNLPPTVEHQPDRLHDSPTIHLKQKAFDEVLEVEKDRVQQEIHGEEKNNASSDADSSAQANKRLWGAAAGAGHASTTSNQEEITESTATAQKVSDSEAAAAAAAAAGGSETRNATKLSSSNIPFVAGNKAREHHHPPPNGFALSARVYIDPSDRLAHFDESAHQITLPYWDCGATGATTSPLPLKNGYFRHALASTSTSWTGTDGKHAVLAVALSPFLLELNSGESHTFDAGDVILLEDVLLSGHKMRPLTGRDLKVMFLTLPQQHLHTGKKHMSLSNLMGVKQSQDPCPDIIPGEHQDSFRQVSSESTMMTMMNSNGWNGRRIRLLVMATISMSLSTLVADFLGKTAPLWLAVGVGGTCFVTGTTYALTMLGDRLWTAIELWQEERLLNRATTTTTSAATAKTTTTVIQENENTRERIEEAMHDHATTETHHAQEATGNVR